MNWVLLCWEIIFFKIFIVLLFLRECLVYSRVMWIINLFFIWLNGRCKNWLVEVKGWLVNMGVFFCIFIEYFLLFVNCDMDIWGVCWFLGLLLRRWRMNFWWVVIVSWKWNFCERIIMNLIIGNVKRILKEVINMIEWYE